MRGLWFFPFSDYVASNTLSVTEFIITLLERRLVTNSKNVIIAGSAIRADTVWSLSDFAVKEFPILLLVRKNIKAIFTCIKYLKSYLILKMTLVAKCKTIQLHSSVGF